MTIQHTYLILDESEPDSEVLGLGYDLLKDDAIIHFIEGGEEKAVLLSPRTYQVLYQTTVAYQMLANDAT